MKNLDLSSAKKVIGGIGGGGGDDGDPIKRTDSTLGSGGGTEPVFKSKRK